MRCNELTHPDAVPGGSGQFNPSHQPVRRGEFLVIMTQYCEGIFLDNENNLLNSKVVNSFDSNRPNFAPYGFTCEVWTPVPMKRPDRHNEIELNLLTHGALHYFLGGQRVTIEAGRLAAFWAAIPHQIIGSADQTKYFVATIPLTWFLQCQFPEPFVQGILHGQILFDAPAGQASNDWELFERWVKNIKATEPAWRRLVLLEMEARLLRFALAVPPKTSGRAKSRLSPTAPATGALNRVEQMAAYIAQNYTQKIKVEEIAHAVGLHPNYAMSLFKKTFGESLIDCITQHRVSHAQRLLATTDVKMVDVALTSGFNSISRFNEAFKRTCHCAPRQYRVNHRLQ